MEKIKKISDFNLNSKKVLVRLDLNVPFRNGKISDPTRIISSLPTLKEILKKNGTPIIISHFGRPKGTLVKSYWTNANDILRNKIQRPFRNSGG